MVSGRRAPARETMQASDRMTYLVVRGRIPPEADRTVRSASPERTEPTPLLNHETSDHLLSLVDNERGPREPHGQCEPRATRIQVLCCGPDCTILARSVFALGRDSWRCRAHSMHRRAAYTQVAVLAGLCVGFPTSADRATGFTPPSSSRTCSGIQPAANAEGVARAEEWIPGQVRDDGGRRVAAVRSIRPWVVALCT